MNIGKQVLITGGAGFIGSHLSDELLRCGYRVRVLDNLAAQVHGQAATVPAYMSADVEMMIGDVRDAQVVRRALEDVDAVFHFSAAVGVAQSMYQVARYTEINNLGTATLLEALIDRPVERLVVASSMSLYGEGLYRSPGGRYITDAERSLEQLKRKDWELHDADGGRLEPVPTPETKPPSLASIYALSKYDQERMCLMIGAAYGIPTVALRFFNVYGPRQALSNPYTGILAIFSARLLNERAPLIFEDGNQRRDFVHVRDVAVVARLALEVPAAAGRALNVGSGLSHSILEIANKLAAVINRNHIAPEITSRYRAGDIRNCFSDITLARRLLDYKPQYTLDQGLAEFAGWVEGQAPLDRVGLATRELETRGLTL
jgi:dTDP-L-rhamnose 4-epimerase